MYLCGFNYKTLNLQKFNLTIRLEMPDYFVLYSMTTLNIRLACHAVSIRDLNTRVL